MSNISISHIPLRSLCYARQCFAPVGQGLMKRCGIAMIIVTQHLQLIAMIHIIAPHKDMAQPALVVIRIMIHHIMHQKLALPTALTLVIREFHFRA